MSNLVYTEKVGTQNSRGSLYNDNLQFLYLNDFRYQCKTL